MSAVVPVVEKAEFGDLLRHWRAVRRISQLDLASAAETTPRYVSFVETGRSQPSRDMVLRLALALDVPLRERNGMLLAAGFAPAYPMAPLGSDQLDRVDTALASMLAQHEPFPAVVMDRGWTVLRANDGAARLFGGLYAPEPLPGRGERAADDGRARPGTPSGAQLGRGGPRRCWSGPGARRSAGSSTRPRPGWCRRCGSGPTSPPCCPGSPRPRRRCRCSTCSSPSRARRRVLLGGVDDRHAGRRDRAGATGGGLLPDRRRQPGGVGTPSR